MNFCGDLTNDKDLKRAKYFEFCDKIKDNVMPLVNEEIISFLPEWEELINIDNKMVCVHTLNVLYLTINDE